ncbi:MULTISPECIES: DUF2939 domain-containing protein [Brevundimonas]|uniref:DUF2939 domain-containing protein n=1 Tax=Brevundimonas TaxID=41275 RepID=UPI001F0BC179|nr:DUF2939 domain-containing protein [Brevundimonas lutea]
MTDPAPPPPPASLPVKTPEATPVIARDEPPPPAPPPPPPPPARGGGLSFGRALAGLLIVAVAMAAMAFVTAPMVAFSAVRSAAEAGDVQGLTRLVDFTAVRASLRPQLDETAPVVEAPPPSFLDNPVEAIRRRLQDQPVFRRPVGPQPDDYLSPTALNRLTRGVGREAWRETAAPEREPAARLTYWGVDRTRMAVTGPEGRTVFTFERRGPFAWRLVHIGLPPRAEPNGQAGVQPGNG